MREQRRYYSVARLVSKVNNEKDISGHRRKAIISEYVRDALGEVGIRQRDIRRSCEKFVDALQRSRPASRGQRRLRDSLIDHLRNTLKEHQLQHVLRGSIRDSDLNPLREANGWEHDELAKEYASTAVKRFDEATQADALFGYQQPPRLMHIRNSLSLFTKIRG